jgi:hypothetical protein
VAEGYWQAVNHGRKKVVGGYYQMGWNKLEKIFGIMGMDSRLYIHPNSKTA